MIYDTERSEYSNGPNTCNRDKFVEGEETWTAVSVYLAPDFRRTRTGRWSRSSRSPSAARRRSRSICRTTGGTSWVPRASVHAPSGRSAAFNAEVDGLPPASQVVAQRRCGVRRGLRQRRPRASEDVHQDDGRREPAVPQRRVLPRHKPNHRPRHPLHRRRTGRHDSGCSKSSVTPTGQGGRQHARWPPCYTEPGVPRSRGPLN